MLKVRGKCKQPVADRFRDFKVFTLSASLYFHFEPNPKKSRKELAAGITEVYDVLEQMGCVPTQLCSNQTCWCF